MYPIDQIAFMVLLTVLPFLELRASIPYGIFETDLPLAVVFMVAVMANILLGPVLFFFLNKTIHRFLKVKLVERGWQRIILRTQKKVHPYIEKYGILGLAVFIGIPLPGSGVYTGALGAYLLGFKFKDFLKATILGVLIAGLIVTIICLAGSQTWDFLIKRMG